jgi:hypothetical protein
MTIRHRFNVHEPNVFGLLQTTTETEKVILDQMETENQDEVDDFDYVGLLPGECKTMILFLNKYFSRRKSTSETSLEKAPRLSMDQSQCSFLANLCHCYHLLHKFLQVEVNLFINFFKITKRLRR